MRALFVIALAGLATGACYAPVSKSGPETAGQAVSAPPCPQPDTGPPVEWNKNVRSSATANLAGDPHHSTNDPIINPGHAADVRGKFAYGTVSKDLQDEEVALWLRMEPCGAWREAGRALTDSDGRMSLTVSQDHFSSPGAYPYQLIVRGDLSRAYGTIYVLPRNTQIVIFDIDGTLTTGDGEVIQQVAFGSEPEAHQGANKVVGYYVKKNYLPVYITGRPYILRASTAQWLRKHSFAPGPLITTNRFTDSKPGENVGEFKRRELLQLRDTLGLSIAAAYGNADSDVCAYSKVGIASTKTFIVSDEPKQCAPHPAAQTFTSYVQHLELLNVEAAAR